MKFVDQDIQKLKHEQDRLTRVFVRVTLNFIIIIITIIIQHLHSALKSDDAEALHGGFRLRLSEQVGFEVFLKVSRVRQARMSEGSEF